ncbi:hypothetical protein Cs7R123_56570 [Catellatospora sp. TT07R-123]|uniref:YdeI/OmpD-associated family protein n=1 Tax=Catellatospora sp. TT07R-123 TaxID=2733863 RepID=UPI001AFFC642|nr:hypothetical protein [Catellatospora sp. TT07R-123]GHJ48315.1 hypothetical protein Cs7R123_56570 [Catellatospora sp. TT07R-123]
MNNHGHAVLDGQAYVFTRPDDFAAWLEEHHAQDGGIWLKIAKAGAAHTTVTGFEAVEVGLCYGWISSLRRPLDRDFFLQRYTRRRPRSPWSRVNVDLVAKLAAEGRMRPPGWAEVHSAQADGRWEQAGLVLRSGGGR